MKGAVLSFLILASAIFSGCNNSSSKESSPIPEGNPEELALEKTKTENPAVKEEVSIQETLSNTKIYNDKAYFRINRYN